MFLNSLEFCDDNTNNWSLKTDRAEYVYSDGKIELIYIQHLWIKEFEELKSTFRSTSREKIFQLKSKLSVHAKPFVPNSENELKINQNTINSNVQNVNKTKVDRLQLQHTKTKKKIFTKKNISPSPNGTTNNYGKISMIHVKSLKDINFKTYRPKRAGIIIRLEIDSFPSNEKKLAIEQEAKTKIINEAMRSGNEIIKLTCEVDETSYVHLHFHLHLHSNLNNSVEDYDYDCNDIHERCDERSCERPNSRQTYFGLGVDWKTGDLTDWGGFAEYMSNKDVRFRKDLNALDAALREFLEESLGVFGIPTKQQLDQSIAICSPEIMIIIITMNNLKDQMYSIQENFKNLIRSKQEYHEMQNIVWLKGEIFDKLIKPPHKNKTKTNTNMNMNMNTLTTKPIPKSKESCKFSPSLFQSQQLQQNQKYSFDKAIFSDFSLYHIVQKVLHGAYYRLKPLF